MFIASCNINLSLKVIFFPKIIAINVVKDINPNPPISINIIITVCPNIFQYVPVSTTINPVTQTADVAVNKASKKLVLSPLVVDIGKVNINAPTNITNINPKTKT